MSKITVETLRQQALASFVIPWERVNLDPEEVIDSWAKTVDDNKLYYDQYGKHRSQACKVYQVARDHGVNAAILWKLSNG